MSHSALKILETNDLVKNVARWKQDGKKIVFTNGCFDLIHAGHVTYLEKARQFGDILVVGLNSDRSVEKLKGVGRPVLDQASRASILAAFEFVDVVTFFEEDTPLGLIQEVLPDVLVKGSDYLAENIVGADIVLGGGGKVKTIELVEGQSTSNIISKIWKLKK